MVVPTSDEHPDKLIVARRRPPRYPPQEPNQAAAAALTVLRCFLRRPCVIRSMLCRIHHPSLVLLLRLRRILSACVRACTPSNSIFNMPLRLLLLRLNRSHARRMMEAETDLSLSLSSIERASERAACTAIQYRRCISLSSLASNTVNSYYRLMRIIRSLSVSFGIIFGSERGREGSIISSIRSQSWSAESRRPAQGTSRL